MRTCADCQASITRKSKTGCCRTCAAIRRNRSPEMRKAMSEAMAAKRRDPCFPQGNNSATLKRLYRNPDQLARIRAAGAKGREARRIPPKHRDLHINLRDRGHKVADVRRMIADLERAEARRVVQRHLDEMARKAQREKEQAY